MTSGAMTEPILFASTRVEEAETRFSEGIQSLASAANIPYKGNTNAPNAKFKRI